MKSPLKFIMDSLSNTASRAFCCACNNTCCENLRWSQQGLRKIKETNIKKKLKIKQGNYKDAASMQQVNIQANNAPVAV